MIDPNTKIDIGTLWLEGCNTSLRPESISERSYVWGINIDNSGGIVSTREGFSQMFQTVAGNIQMVAHFRDATNTDWVVTAASGYIYASLYPFTDWMIISQQDDIKLDPSAPFYTHCSVTRGACRVTQTEGQGETKKIATENYLVISDGVNPPVYFDGGRLRQSIPEEFGIPLCSWMTFCKNRLWVWDTANQCLKFSDIDNPLTFYTVTFLAPGGGYSLGSPCTGLIAAPDESGDFLAFERDKTWIFRTSADITGEVDWKATSGFQKVLFPHIGCMDGGSFTKHYGDLWWWSQRGLISLRRASNSLKDDEVNPTDLEMTRSRETFEVEDGRICGISHDNYLLIATPKGDIWVKNNSPASLLNSDTPPAWMSVWTGLRVREFCSFVAINDSQRWTIGFSADYDGKNRLWKLFNDTHFDNGSPIKCFAEFRAHPIAGLYTRKRFGNVAAKIHGLFGDVSLNAFYRGTRGAWKQIMDTTLRAATNFDENGRPITQSRDVTSPEVTHKSSCNCGEESNLTDNVDGAFQVMFSWTGQLSIGSYQIVTYEDAQDFHGKCPKRETTPSTIHTCSPVVYDYSPSYNEQMNYNDTVTFGACRVTCRPYRSAESKRETQDTTWTVIRAGETFNPTLERIAEIGKCREFDSGREYTSTQTVTVYCVSGIGTPITKTGTATSTVSQLAADEEARSIARAEADLELMCEWTEKATVGSTCGDGLIGEPIIETATYTSTISKEDALQNATALATAAVNARIECGPPEPGNIVVTGLRKRDTSDDPSESIEGMGSFGLLNSVGTPDYANWLGGSGPNGEVNSASGDWISGTFTKYDTISRFNLANVGPTGALNTAYPDYFAKIPGHPSNSISSIDVGMDGYLGVTGSIRSFMGNPYASSNSKSYLLINPAANTVISSVLASSTLGDELGGTILGHDYFHRRYFSSPSEFTRILQDGTKDATFATVGPGETQDGSAAQIFSIFVDNANDRIYLRGDFVKYDGQKVPTGVCRVYLSNGKIDKSFKPAGFTVATDSSPNFMHGVGSIIVIDSSVYTIGYDPKTGYNRVLKLSASGKTDSKFNSPFIYGPAVLSKKFGGLIVVSTGSFQVKDIWGDPTKYVVIDRRGAIKINLDTGAFASIFNSDPSYVAYDSSSFITSNPGWLNELTYIRP